MLVIEEVNDVWIRISCEESIARELSDYFSFEIKSAEFVKRKLGRHWDGRIRLFKLKGHLLYRGLVPRVIKFAQERDYEVVNNIPEHTTSNYDPQITAVSKTLPVEPYDYQITAIKDILARNRGILLSPTGSGKSLIQYMLVRLIRQQTLIVVPTIGLVAQMHKDFIDYGCDPNFIQTIQAGTTQIVTAPIVISTWQSIFDNPIHWFNRFGCIMVDEVHGAKAKSLTGLLEKCTNVRYRIGCTGTLDDTEAHRLILEGLFGTVFKTTTTKKLQQEERLAPLKVKLCVIKYPEATRKQLRRATYPDEMEFLVTDPARLELIARMATKCRGNVLVLFQFVEKHGKPLFQRIQELAPGRVHFVSGEVDADNRERIRQLVEQGDHQIIVASYGTFSTGINIPNLDTLIFASPSKSRIRVLQSIGRTLRKYASKSHATLIDIVDDLRIGKWVNHTFKHAEARAEYYVSEQFPYTLTEQGMEVWLEFLKN